jgi:transposase
MSDLYWLTDEQMTGLRPFSPKSHGRPRVDDRRVLSGIVFANRNGLRWCDAPKDYGPHKTLYNRWKRWGEKGIFLQMMEGLAAASDEPKTVIREWEFRGFAARLSGPERRASVARSGRNRRPGGRTGAT